MRYFTIYEQYEQEGDFGILGKMEYQQRIKSYYNNSQKIYELFLYNKKSLGIHFGFWNKKTKNRQAAILNENQAVIDAGKIKSKHKVLDAGCGVGGTVIYIARKIGAKVVGISLVQRQIDLAKKYAKDNGVEKLTDFQVQDYTKTDFKDNWFDIVYGIESICHAFPKSAFLKEAYRVLKPGGKLVIADGYLKRKPKTEEERKIVNDFNKGFSLKELIVVKDMERQIKEAGFKKVKGVNKLKEVKPSIDHFYKFMKRIRGVIKMVGWIPLPFCFGLRSNWLSLFHLGEGVKKGLMTYYLHVGEK